MTSSKITKEEISYINRAKAGEQSAYTWIFNKYQKFVEDLLISYLKDEDEARSLTNVVFLKVFKKLDKFTAYNSFGGWLRILVNRVAVDYLRIKENKRYILSENGDDTFILDDNEDMEYDTVNHMEVSDIFKILDRYRPHVRKIFELHYLQNMPVEMVATKLHIPTGTVKSVLSRTRNKIRNQLTKKQ
ncbi:RNA polymerase sigma factor [Sharpea azabuensis]|uniref:RNA polymerase sigma factor n=1 Tax=Sharpea azabuensis TaxID=322505 RepID=UPI00156A244A|nr:RNA polymerase sigma factor [Sharpea azabuensis]